MDKDFAHALVPELHATNLHELFYAFQHAARWLSAPVWK
jgi:hypothetical protein